ncbi:dUTP diphosphatase [soil metagenome]
MNEVEIKILNHSSNDLPSYATTGSAGLDLRADLEAPVSLKPLERIIVPTGIFIEIPPGFEGQVRPRSGLALKYGITCLNSPGTVDSDYRGELKVILVNISDKEFTISHGERIAQLVISKIEKAKLIPVTSLETSLRGEGGFGHTGL